MRADLVLKARFDSEIGGLGEGGGIIKASYGGGEGDLGRHSARGGDFGVRTRGGRWNGVGMGGGEGGVSAGGRARPRSSAGPMRYGSGEDAATHYRSKKGAGITDAGRERVGSWMNFFMRSPGAGGMGLPRGRAAAMVAMMQGESGQNLDPSKEYWDVNGPSGGTAAWHDKNGRGRLSNLKAFAGKLGKSWKDVDVQQQFWKHEAETSQRGAWDAVVNAPSDEEALRQGVKKFEVPANPEGETRKRMPNLARLKNGEFDKAPVAAKPPRTTLPADARSSPRFQQPDQMRVDAGAPAGAGGAGRQQVAMNDGPPAIQHFYGGFDEVAVARRSQLESNRQIRRSQARALHDLGRIA